MGMTKIIYGADFDATCGVGMEIVDRQGELHKQASTIFGMDYDVMKPDDKHVGIHVVALGDSEHYQFNRNGDGFPKKACVDYHDTFVKHGHVFRHHMNKQAEKAIGIVKASAYNEPMGRIELFIHADKDKAAPELARLEKEGEVPFSMACTVDHDRCSICGAMRKHAGDSSECDHVANHLGELFEDGKQVGTYNDEPRFFDISFVGRPADRIAWSLKVASASALPLGSVKEAELEGVYPPDELVCEKGASARKLGYARDIVGLQQIYRGWMSKSASVRTPTEMYLYELRRVRTGGLPDDVVSRLREVNEKVAMHMLASNGVVMDIPTFFKYATGDDYVPVVEKYIVPLMSYYPSYLEDMVEKSAASRFCANGMFDVSEQYARDLPFEIERSVKEAAFADDVRRIAVESSGSLEEPHLVDTKVPDWFNGPVVEKLAETYASYQMSAVDAVLGTGSRNKLDVEAVLAANNVSQR